MARGRPRDPQRGKSHSTGHRPQTGSGPPAVVVPAAAPELAHREPPPDMPAVAKDVWRTIVTDMSALRTLREVDLPLVRAYCQAAQIHADASDLITRKGVLVAGPSGPMTNPMIKVAKDAAVTMRQLSDVLGLNPLARIRGNLMEAATGSLVFAIQKRLRDLMGG